jgi:hypothetical protein
MEKESIVELVIFLCLVLFIISLMVLLYFISPEQIVAKMGISNVYLFTLLISFFAGFSAWTSFSMVAILLTFVAGGISPIFLGLITGLGLAVGDIIMFFVGSRGRKLISGRWKKRLNKIARFFDGKLKKLVPFLCYIYIGLTPFPNNFLIIFLALIKYPIKKLYVPIVLGDMTFPLVITLLAAKGITFFW